MNLPSNYELDLGPHGEAQNTSAQMFNKKDHKDRSVMGAVIAAELDVPSPRVFHDPVADEVISVSSGKDPVDLSDVVNEDIDRPIDEDSLLDAYAVKILLGDTDAHAKNIAVLPDGTSYSFDFGYNVSEIGYTMRYVADKVKANIGKLNRETNLNIRKDQVEKRLRERVDEFAEDIDFSEVKSRLTARREVPDETRYSDHLNTRIENLKKAKIGNWSADSGDEIAGRSSLEYLLGDDGILSKAKLTNNFVNDYLALGSSTTEDTFQPDKLYDRKEPSGIFDESVGIDKKDYFRDNRLKDHDFEYQSIIID